MHSSSSPTPTHPSASADPRIGAADQLARSIHERHAIAGVIMATDVAPVVP
jgi:hypothetical protein